MKNVLWFYGALFIDYIMGFVFATLLVFIIPFFMAIIQHIFKIDNLKDFLPYIKYSWFLYLLFCNVFYVSIGCRILKIRYTGNKYLILLSNLILLAAWFGAFKNITVLQILGIIDLICLFIPKINQRLTNYLLKISIAPKEPATAAAAENTESGN